MAVVGAIIAGAGAIFGVAMQMKAQKANEKAQKAQQRAQELADLRARRRLLRESAQVRGETVNTAANYGAMNSSAIYGGLSGLTNQAQSQLGFQQTTLDLSKYITKQNIAMARYDTLGSAVSSVSSMFKNFKGLPNSTVRSGYQGVSPNLSLPS
jgi:argininosuccinate lyase